MLISFLVVLGLILYCMKPDERARAARFAVAVAKHLKDETVRRRQEPEPFRDALRARTPRALVTPTLVALMAAWFVFSGFGPDDTESLLRWGASAGPKTTHGEWWRLVTAMFVHSGFMHLVATIFGLTQAGLIAERLVGSPTFASVYFSAGLLAGIAGLAADPIDPHAGPAGAICGVYGFLVALAVAAAIQRAPLTLSTTAAKQLAPGPVFFVFYTAAAQQLDGGGVLAALATGAAFGAAVTVRAATAKPSPGRTAAALGVAVLLALVAARPLRGVTDVRPEIQRVVATEDRLASTYDTAVGRFRQNRITAVALAQLIDRAIVPELQAAHLHLKKLERVPPRQQPLVEGAVEYFRLRDESWRLRAEGLRTTSMAALQAAERSERASLEALQRIK